MARIAWQHPAAAALIDLKKGEREPQPTAALLIDLGKDKPAFAKHLAAAATVRGYSWQWRRLVGRRLEGMRG